MNGAVLIASHAVPCLYMHDSLCLTFRVCRNMHDQTQTQRYAESTDGGLTPVLHTRDRQGALSRGQQ